MLHDTSALAKSMDSILASPFTHDQKGDLGTHSAEADGVAPTVDCSDSGKSSMQPCSISALVQVSRIA